MKSMIVKRTGASLEGTAWSQWIGGMGSMLMLLASGLMGGWTSPYLAKLTAEDSLFPVPITLQEASWVASLLNLGRMLGAVFGSISVYYFGSKKTLMYNSCPLTVSWVVLIAADSVVWLYATRFISGVSLGIVFSSFPIFIGEISSPGIRGGLVSLATNRLPFGVLAGNIIGALVPMSVFGYISLVPTAGSVILFLCIPESPHHLVRVNKIEEAKKSIAKYHPGLDVEIEIKSLEEFVTSIQSITFADKLREFNIPQNRKAGMIIVLLYLFMQLSGINNLVFYMEIILTDGGLTVIKPATMVIVAGASGILSGFGAIYLSDKFGRKPLLIVSTAGVILSMVTLGAHFALLNGGFDPAGLQWLLIFSILTFDAFVFLGLCPVPSMVLSELFAPNIKGIAACLASISVGTFSFISTKTYQLMLAAMGEAYVFWLNGAMMVNVLIFALTIMPETKGKSLQEIQNMLHKK